MGKLLIKAICINAVLAALFLVTWNVVEMIHFLISLMTNYVEIKEQERHFLHILKVWLKILLLVQKFFQSLGCSDGLIVVVLSSASLSPWLTLKALAWQKLSVAVKNGCVSLGGSILVIEQPQKVKIRLQFYYQKNVNWTTQNIWKLFCWFEMESTFVMPSAWPKF